MARIVLIVPSFPKLSESFIVSKFLGLLARGWDMHVVCQQSPKEEWKWYPQLQGDSIPRRVHLTAPTKPPWSVLLRWPGTAVATALKSPRQTKNYWQSSWPEQKWHTGKYFYLDAQLIKLKPDIIHFGFGALAPGRTYLKQKLGCKMTASFRGYDLNFVGLENPLYYQSVWQHMDGLHFLGHDLWRRAQQRGCPSHLFHALIPPAIDTQKFDPGERVFVEHVGSDERPLRIISVGRLEWKKGYEYALQAIQQLVAQGIRVDYRIIGEGFYLQPLSFMRHQLNLESQVKFEGAKSQSEIVEALGWADVFLHTAVSEGFCNAVLEAQAMQLPIVASDADGLSENVADGETGFVVPRRNPNAFVEKLIILGNNSSLRRRFGEAGRKRVRQQFQILQQIDAFDTLFKEVLLRNGESHARSMG